MTELALAVGLALAYLLAVAPGIFCWAYSRRRRQLRAHEARRMLRMEAHVVVCRDRFYSGRTADAVNGLGRALARELCDLTP